MATLPRLSFIAALSVLLLSGCDMLGLESATAVAARREAEGKAVGGACRQAGRGIEDCYTLNRKADKAAVFAGWREMNDYMRENKLDAIPPQLGPGTEVAKSQPEPSPPAAEEPASAPPPKKGKAAEKAEPKKHETS